MSIGNRVFLKRPMVSDEVLKRLEETPSSIVGDAMGRAYSMSMKRVLDKHMLGRAVTVKAPAGDNFMFYKAMQMAQPGDVIVVDGEGFDNRAIFGDIMGAVALSQGIKGIVINGSIRDVKKLEKMELPVYYKHLSPNGPLQNGPGEINVPISIDNEVIYPGDIIVGDQDGLISIRPHEVEGLFQAMEDKVASEKEELDTIAKGEYSFDWIDEKIDDLATKIVDDEYNSF